MAKARAIIGLNQQAPTAQNARIILRERLADMYSYAEYIESPANIQELHDLRIAAKRVRYTLETFATFLPQESQGFAEELATLQDKLGELHDSEVMLALLRRVLQQEQAEAVVEAETVVEQEQMLPLGTYKPLLSPDLLSNILNTTNEPTAREHQGLVSFLRKQEKRRAACHITFRQHWEKLEQSHFRETILAMLEQEERKEGK
jgi:hypothetical protein